MGAVATSEIPQWFLAEMTRLVGLKFAPADMRTHWEALHEIPRMVLRAAVSRAGRTREEFPSPVELRQDCDAVSHTIRLVDPDEDRGTDLPEPVELGTLPTGKKLTAERVWRYYHSECSDSGIESLWCGAEGPQMKPWHTRQACERTKAHEPHEWTRKCTCFDSNPALIKQRERQRQYAETKAKK